MRIVAEGIVVQYPNAPRPVLDGVDLALDDGDSLAILGPSGSGKSTLLSVLGGFLRPSRGRVWVDPGEDSAGGGPMLRLKDMSSWILQTTNILPERSALDNVTIAGLTRGLTRSDARREAVSQLTAVGLGDRQDAPARLLSGGEVQRIVIARALISTRPFILADEPTGQLDHATSDAVLDALFAATGGAGIVAVTHDPAVASRCARIVRIDNGTLVAA